MATGNAVHHAGEEPLVALVVLVLASSHRLLKLATLKKEQIERAVRRNRAPESGTSTKRVAPTDWTEKNLSTTQYADVAMLGLTCMTTQKSICLCRQSNNRSILFPPVHILTKP
jgi:hypothetical protein